MALRDQPYLPLYVQDYLTDEKLNMCSAASQGVYIKLMCIMHKSEIYGKILFKQKYKQKESIIENFALQISKQITFDVKTIQDALVELIEESVLILEDETIYQKRMVRDFEISEQRSLAAKKGGGNPVLFKQNNKQEFKQKDKQNTENENEYEIKIPSLIEVESYFKEKGYNKIGAEKFFNYYTETAWKDKDGKPVKNWKLKAVNVWFRDEYKIKQREMVY